MKFKWPWTVEEEIKAEEVTKRDNNIEPEQFEEAREEYVKSFYRPNHDNKPELPKVVDTYVDPNIQLDVGSATWGYLCKHMSDRIDKLRKENDNVCDESNTATRRGRIAELKELMKLPEKIKAGLSTL